MENNSPWLNSKLSITMGWLLLAMPVLILWGSTAEAELVKCRGKDCLYPSSGGGIEALLNIPVVVFNVLIGLSALVLMGVIVWAGIRMMLYHLSEQPEAELTAAKMTLTRGLFGFLIVVCTFVIVHTFIYFVLGLGVKSNVAYLLHQFGL